MQTTDESAKHVYTDQSSQYQHAPKDLESPANPLPPQEDASQMSDEGCEEKAASLDSPPERKFSDETKQRRDRSASRRAKQREGFRKYPFLRAAKLPQIVINRSDSLFSNRHDSLFRSFPQNAHRLITHIVEI